MESIVRLRRMRSDGLLVDYSTSKCVTYKSLYKFHERDHNNLLDIVIKPKYFVLLLPNIFLKFVLMND
jgi:acetoacetate decarboxylase